MKNIEVKFPRKPNSFQEIQKKFHKTDQKNSKMASRRGESAVSIFKDVFCITPMLKAVSIGVIQKTSLKIFMRQGLTALNK